MKKFTALTITAALALTGVVAIADSHGGDEGKALFEEKCTLCHDAERSLSKNKEREAWERTVNRMMKKNPGHITAEQAKTITDYLARERGK